ncbi:sterol desaturase family protein [Tropicibacter sp. Alg240-R139]|uniref:sterol desaturase family protein n=1 Tax=Tropicibacter sp. Alg240-R139 TaxID=2305991 RepID=UPI0013DF18E2|nr:sterol desaturase family protein [Tropicibacter sp. Alg240-R139]
MEYEIPIRFAAFLGLIVFFASAETALPRRPRLLSRMSRWRTNLCITILNTLTLRLMAAVMPLLAIGAAWDAQKQGWGLFNTLELYAWVELIICILVLDFAIWAQHLVTHKVPLLWRLHRVHHADRDMDVTTAVRFHPVEIALSMLLKIGLVYLLGPSVLAVLVFEVLLNGTALFNHANLKLPLALDAVLRRVLVTPDMHRVHHSVHRHEHDSNYGFALSIWDRMLGTYVAQPDQGHDQMTVGLEWQDDRPAHLRWSLMLPFQRK